MCELPRTNASGMQHVTYNLESAGQLWADTLMMTALPLAKIGKVLNRPQYVDEALSQLYLHLQVLWDAPTGLFFHAWQFATTQGGSDPAHGHNFARAGWARANAWITMAIPEFIELLELRENDPLRRMLENTLEPQVAALVRLQSPNGPWHTLLDLGNTKGNYEEASATAGFAYGMLIALRKRYLGKGDRGLQDDVEQSAMRAVGALLENIDDQGALSKVSFGTPVFDSLDEYLEVPRRTARQWP